jgi:hypothetical protein
MLSTRPDNSEFRVDYGHISSIASCLIYLSVVFSFHFEAFWCNCSFSKWIILGCGKHGDFHGCSYITICCFMILF